MNPGCSTNLDAAMAARFQEVHQLMAAHLEIVRNSQRQAEGAIAITEGALSSKAPHWLYQLVITDLRTIRRRLNTLIELIERLHTAE